MKTFVQKAATMFLYCDIIRKICPMAGLDHNNELRCGFKSGENRIRKLTQCPCKKIRDREQKKKGNAKI